ncbi:MAG: hypothetical protein ACPGWR_18470 [Ardenticatenaceae bacterium]
MNDYWQKWVGRWWPLLSVLLLGAYWLLPVSGDVIVRQGAFSDGPWPQMWLEQPSGGESTMIHVRDTTPWPYVLLTVNEQPAQLEGFKENLDGSWNWTWSFVAHERIKRLVFFHNCDTGCIERGRVAWDKPILSTEERSKPLVGTKLGVVFPDANRDWHGRSGWGVELTYAQLGEEEHWGIDDLAVRVQKASANGLRVLVRVDYEQGQSLPPSDDYIALESYLRYLQRLAQDDRLQDTVYGYLIGSGYNALGSNTQAPNKPVTPQWYARLFNGYGAPLHHSDNVVQTIRAANPQVRVLVGPVQPWNMQQNGTQAYKIDMPWLNYFNTLVAALNESTQAKAQAGIPLTAPDGFALHVPGRPEAPELANRDPASEPALTLPRQEWKQAQAGFQLYQEWLDIINSYPTTQGVPAYITATNTFTPDTGGLPAQNYPRGWLTTALGAINNEPQIHALCWFLDADSSGDKRWQMFSLVEQSGRLIDTAEEFDALLRQE